MAHVKTASVVNAAQDAVFHFMSRPENAQRFIRPVRRACQRRSGLGVGDEAVLHVHLFGYRIESLWAMTRYVPTEAFSLHSHGRLHRIDVDVDLLPTTGGATLVTVACTYHLRNIPKPVVSAASQIAQREIEATLSRIEAGIRELRAAAQD